MQQALRDPVVLAITFSQLVISAGLYYVFPALVLFWQTDFGWTLTQIMGAFSLALIMQGLTAKSIGRLLDRGFDAWAIAAGGVVAALGLLAVTLVEGLAFFYVCWAVLRFAMGLTLYDAVFALIIRARGDKAMAPIAVVTPLAGLASSIASVFAGVVGELFGWRAVLLLMATAILLVHVPLVFWATSRLEAAEAPPVEKRPSDGLTRRLGYLPLTAALTLSALALGMVISHIMPLLTWTGAAAGQVLLAASMIGVAQVAGRLIVVAMGGIWNRPTLAAFCLFGLALGLLTLSVAPIASALIFAFAILQGACDGISSALRPMLIRDVLGQASFGTAQGAVLAPALIAFGLAPIIAAQIAHIGGYTGLITVGICVQLASAALLANLLRTPGLSPKAETSCLPKEGCTPLSMKPLDRNGTFQQIKWNVPNLGRERPWSGL
ncbi:MAG: MFS transporter [Rhodobacteraceae bacterium]|nr:MFS transporter [Paracoccaceae bacterium]